MARPKASAGMSKLHEKCIIRNHTYLIEQLKGLGKWGLFDKMTENEVMRKKWIDEIKEIKYASEQIGKLLDELQRSGPHAWDGFLHCLDACDFQDISWRLRETEKLLEENIDTNARQLNEYFEKNHPPENVQSKLRKSMAPSKGPVYGSASPNEEEQYVMESRPRGLMLIINNEDFSRCGKENREGSKKDCDGLKDMFQRFGFLVEVENNQTKEQMVACIKFYAKMANEGSYDSVVVTILSHGDESVFYGVDGKAIMESELTGPFNGLNSENLRGKPKLFILQVCRGDKTRQSVSHDGPNKKPPSNFLVQEGEAREEPNIPTTVDDEEEEMSRALDRLKITQNRHPDADMVLAYSTLPGHLSMREDNNGSWFVQSLIEVFTEHAHDTEMLVLLRMVNKRMSQKMLKSTAQIPQPRFTTLKAWYLNPVQD